MQVTICKYHVGLETLMHQLECQMFEEGYPSDSGCLSWQIGKQQLRHPTFTQCSGCCSISCIRVAGIGQCWQEVSIRLPVLRSTTYICTTVVYSDLVGKWDYSSISHNFMNGTTLLFIPRIIIISRKCFALGQNSTFLR